MIMVMDLNRYFRFPDGLWVQEIDKKIRGKADTPASFPAVKGMRGK